MSSSWKMLGWYVGGAAVVTVVTQSTPNPVPFVILGCLIVYFGSLIIDRLADVPSKSGLQSEWIEDYLTIQVDYFEEEEFRVCLEDSAWQVGRSFRLSGNIISKPDNIIEGVSLSDRPTIQIYNLPGWFESAHIGNILSNGRFIIGLPLSLSIQLLEDFRKDSNQRVKIGFKAQKNSNDKIIYRIYYFEVDRSPF